MPRHLRGDAVTLRLTFALVLYSGPPSTGPVPRSVTACRTCHAAIVESFLRTAHFKTSAEATAQSIRGDFRPGHNLLQTATPGVRFLMQRKSGKFYQTGVNTGRQQYVTEKLDLVVGSGRRGQTYLYWKNRILFELPVSWLTAGSHWINSPGYPDGRVDFGRIIQPRCLECHATSFTVDSLEGQKRYSNQYELGVTCAKCHGDGSAHVTYQTTQRAHARPQDIVNPARLIRARRLDNCALCHSGGRRARKPAFSYQPGQPLDDFLAPHPVGESPVPDVHGNQVGLLERSKCFRASPEMSCSTCHDVHQPQRDLSVLSRKCLQCHDVRGHPQRSEIGARFTALCIDCHMPNRNSDALQFHSARGDFPMQFRSHEIGIYRDVSTALLHAGVRR